MSSSRRPSQTPWYLRLCLHQSHTWATCLTTPVWFLVPGEGPDPALLTREFRFIEVMKPHLRPGKWPHLTSYTCSTSGSTSSKLPGCSAGSQSGRGRTTSGGEEPLESQRDIIQSVDQSINQPLLILQRWLIFDWRLFYPLISSDTSAFTCTSTETSLLLEFTEFLLKDRQVRQTDRQVRHTERQTG